MTKALFHLRQFRLLLLFLLCALFSLPLSAQEAYVVQSTDLKTLFFYYDNNRELRSGKTWGINAKSNESLWVSTPVWAGTGRHPNNVVTKVVFDASFKDFRPTTTNYWFFYLKALTTIEGLQNLNTSAVTNMRDMFSGCSGLKELNISNFNTSPVMDMSGMLSSCSGLMCLPIVNVTASKMKNMDRMFFGCSGLTFLNLSNFNTSKVTIMSGMFKNCFRLNELNISNFNTSAVWNMREMF